MTEREFYTMVINGEINEDVIAHAEKGIERLDNRNAKRKTSASAQKRNAELDALADKVMEILGEEPMTAKAIAEKVGVTPQKITGLKKRLEGRGVKVVDIINNKRIVNGYVK